MFKDSNQNQSVAKRKRDIARPNLSLRKAWVGVFKSRSANAFRHRTLSAGSVSLPLGTILKTYCKQNRGFSVAIIIIAIMVTPFLVNYLNGARVLTQQVLSRHNSLEGTEIILFVCLFQ